MQMVTIWRLVKRRDGKEYHKNIAGFLGEGAGYSAEVPKFVKRYRGGQSQ